MKLLDSPVDCELDSLIVLSKECVVVGEVDSLASVIGDFSVDVLLVSGLSVKIVAALSLVDDCCMVVVSTCGLEKVWKRVGSLLCSVELWIVVLDIKVLVGSLLLVSSTFVVVAVSVVDTPP